MAQISLNTRVKPQAEELTRRGRLFSNERSMREQPYPEGRSFSFSDALRFLMKAGMIKRVMSSLNRSISLIKTTADTAKNQLNTSDYNELESLFNDLGVDSYGFLELDEQSVFAGQGIPYRFAIVITINMDKVAFKCTPSMEAQLEVMKIYGDTGKAVNKITKFLRDRGYNAAPNHSMGGNIDYCKAGMNAGLGYIGRHGMLITTKNGPCHRSAVVYTDISNLHEHFPKQEDHSWIAEFCASCGRCIKKCPTDAILEEASVDQYGNVTSIDYDLCCKGFNKYGCGVCITECLFTKYGYEKNHSQYQLKKKKNQQPS